jgi:hypothetical protein
VDQGFVSKFLSQLLGSFKLKEFEKIRI